MSIDIAAAEERIQGVLPHVTELAGEINTKGTFLIFDHIDIKEPVIGGVNYIFNVYVSVSSKTKNKRLLYEPINAALNPLIEAVVNGECLSLGKIIPYAIKGLLIYKIPVTVEGFIPDECI